MRFDSNIYYHEVEQYPADKLTQEWKETALLYDQTDFTGVWVGEHHFWYSGWPVAAPNPVQVCTFFAGLTERIRVGQTACILPDWNPIRLAEELAMLDNMCKGRLDVGIARGTDSTASIQFNVNANRRDRETNYALFSETLDILLKAWGEGAFSHEGRFYTYPVPGWKEKDPEIYSGDPTHFAEDGELIGLHVMPKPYQKPRPPIYQAADSTSSYTFAGSRGICTTTVGRSFEGAREAWNAYQTAATEATGRDIQFARTPDGLSLNVMRLTHVAETQEQAEKEARAGVNAFFKAAVGVNDRWGRKGSVAEGEELTDDDLNMDWFDFAQKKEIIWVGSPDYVAEKIAHLQEDLDCQHVTLWPNPGFVPFSTVYHSLELFNERVIPQFSREVSRAPVAAS